MSAADNLLNNFVIGQVYFYDFSQKKGFGISCKLTFSMLDKFSASANRKVVGIISCLKSCCNFQI